VNPVFVSALAATFAFIAGFGISMLINSAIRGPLRWTKGDKAAAALIVGVFLALMWIAALAKLVVSG